MDTLEEIKKERESVPDFMYIQRLEKYCERLENNYEQLQKEAEANINYLVKQKEELQAKISKLTKCCILIGLTEERQNDLLNLLNR